MEKVVTQESWPNDKEEQLNQLLASVNIETKSVLLAWCLDDRFKDRQELAVRFNELCGLCIFSNAHLRMEGYAEKTLVPIGLVAKSRFVDTANPEEQGIEYALTTAGRDYGRVLAAFSLDWAVNNDISLYNVLGSTQSAGDTRSPSNSFRILEEITKAEKNTIAKIAERVNIKPSIVGQQLVRLQKNGLVIVESVNCETRGWAEYTWIEGKDPANVKPINYLAADTERVVRELARQRKPLNYHQLCAVFGSEDKWYQSRICNILSELKRQGFVAAKFSGVHERSLVSCTEQGNKIIQGYVQPVRLFIEKCTGVVKDTFEKYLSSEEMKAECATKAAQMYSRISPHINAQQKSITFESITDCIKTHGELRPRDVVEKLGLTRSTVDDYISELCKNGVLSKRKECSATFYRVVG